MGKAVFGGGCFWCVEAVIQRLKGVESIVSGYAGGTVPGHPTYREVCSGLTGHAEVVEVAFNEAVLSYKDLLMVFMTTHDPTTLNRQGADVGTQYRSVIFYASEEQKKIAEQVVDEVSAYYNNSIVTAIEPLKKFYKAEEEHQNYYNLHPEQGFCQIVISPKVAKLKKLYADKLK